MKHTLQPKSASSIGASGQRCSLGSKQRSPGPTCRLVSCPFPRSLPSARRGAMESWPDSGLFQSQDTLAPFAQVGGASTRENKHDCMPYASSSEFLSLVVARENLSSYWNPFALRAPWRNGRWRRHTSVGNVEARPAQQFHSAWLNGNKSCRSASNMSMWLAKCPASCRIRLDACHLQVLGVGWVVGLVLAFACD